MKSQRFILSLKYTAGDSASAVRKAVGGFLRYVQYRDHHQDQEQVKDVQGLLRYVAWRDVATPQGRLFDCDGSVGDEERRQLGAHIARSMANAKPGKAPIRACYRMVLSPEDARGVDLRRLARAAMAQLERDAGEGGIGPWIAAEHRNTAHPHVHIVLAARREVGPDRFRALLITKPRLARMKEAIALEMTRQRGEREQVQESQSTLRAIAHGRPVRDERQRDVWDRAHHGSRARMRARTPRVPSHRRSQLQLLAARLAWHYRREAERLAQESAWEREAEWER